MSSNAKNKRDMQDASGLTPNAKVRGAGTKPKMILPKGQDDADRNSDPLQTHNTLDENTLDTIFPELLGIKRMEFMGLTKKDRFPLACE